MKKLVEIDHFKHFRFPSNIRMDGGGKLYFILKSANMEENGYDSDLYTLDAAGCLQRLTTSRDVSDYHLTGDGILIRSLREPKDKEAVKAGKPLTVFYRLSEGLGEPQEALRLPMTVASAYFLADGRLLFTAQYDHRYEQALELAQGDAGQALEALKAEEDYTVLDEIPFWLNGAGLTNKKRSRLYLYDHGQITPLTDPYTEARILALSPDGASALFTACAYQDKQPLDNRLCRVDLATAAVADISPLPSASYDMASYIDPQHIVLFLNEGKRYGLNENDSFYRMDLESRRLTLLYGGGAFSTYSSVGSDVKMGGSSLPQLWVRDGAYYFISTLDDSSYVMRGSLEGGAPQPLHTARGAVQEAFPSPEGFTLVAIRGLAGSELYALSLDGREQRLSAVNSWLSEEYEAAAPLDLAFTNERGDEIHGFVLPPVGYDPGKQYPVILDIHGGPKAVFGNGYFHEMQYWAALGYGVIFCNPTGSDGRGDAFADIRGAYGTVDYRDIMTFVDRALEAFPFLDSQRMGVTGGSYGGFMTNWIIGHTRRFKAAASQRSIANWISFFNTTDIGYYFGEDQNAATPWSDLKKVWDQSPLQFADQAVTPTLFIHSDQDYRCWMAEGLQMFYALKYHGVPARLCLFKGENHELSRSGKPLHRIRRLKEITQWMDRYLKAEE